MWALASLGYSLLLGWFVHANRTWQIPGRTLIIIRGGGPVLLLAPVLLFFTPPDDPVFYLACLGTGLIGYFHDVRLMDAGARYGGAVTLRVLPLALPLIFLLWFLFDRTQADYLLARPGDLAMIAAAMGGIMVSLFFLRRCNVTMDALRFVAPILPLAVIIDINNKLAQSHAPWPNNTIYYAVIVSLVLFILGAIEAMMRREHATAVLHARLKQGMAIGMIITALMLFKGTAMYLAPNPAYVTAVSLTSTFWVSLWNRAHGRKDDGNIIAGGALVIFVMLLALAVAQTH
ncbi:MAG: hypothetical protein GC131_05085 [Alphaproteobacteria bacterium]|nr:hypothetical protein [Alphaproteobacteria bacterium]